MTNGKRIVEVEWEDSNAVHGWHKSEDNDYTTSPCVSVGYVVDDRDEAISLAESLDQSPDKPNVKIHNHGCVTTIPRSAIRKVTELSRKR